MPHEHGTGNALGTRSWESQICQRCEAVFLLFFFNGNLYTLTFGEIESVIWAVLDSFFFFAFMNGKGHLRVVYLAVS